MIALAITLGIVLGFVFFLFGSYISIKIYAYLKDRNQKSRREVWKATHTAALRGNLVKTFREPIDNHYYLDVEQELGKGGCGVVVIAQRIDNGEFYAVKRVDKSTMEKGRIERELKLLKDVDHANIVRVFSVYEEPTQVYFVMELCTGGHLGNLIARQPRKQLDEEWAKTLCRQLLSAVAHIHSRGIAHRDIKLQNILMDHGNDRTSQVKLIDFGYGSRYVGALPMRTKCGTPYTTAPEVLRECYDERCDVWSVGVVLYIMLSGKRPFEALDIPGPLSEAGKAAMITNILACRYHFNHNSFTTVSKAAKQFVQTLLHPDYKTRISAQEALESPWLRSAALGDKELAKISKSYKSSRVISNLKMTCEASALRQAGSLALVFNMQPTAANEMRSIFQAFDSDGSGTLSRAEFQKAMSVLAPELSAEDVSRLFQIVDIDCNGSISYTEFLAATLDPRDIDISELNEAFKLMDDDGNGYITVDELKKVLTVKSEQQFQLPPSVPSFTGLLRRDSSTASLQQSQQPNQLGQGNEKATLESRIRDIIATCDVDNDGVISYDEFLWAMTGAGRMFGEMPSTFGHNASHSEGNKIRMTSDSLQPCRSMRLDRQRSLTGSLKRENSGGGSKKLSSQDNHSDGRTSPVWTVQRDYSIASSTDHNHNHNRAHSPISTTNVTQVNNGIATIKSDTTSNNHESNESNSKQCATNRPPSRNGMLPIELMIRTSLHIDQNTHNNNSANNANNNNSGSHGSGSGHHHILHHHLHPARVSPHPSPRNGLAFYDLENHVQVSGASQYHATDVDSDSSIGLTFSSIKSRSLTSMVTSRSNSGNLLTGSSKKVAIYSSDHDSGGDDDGGSHSRRCDDTDTETRSSSDDKANNAMPVFHTDGLDPIAEGMQEETEILVRSRLNSVAKDISGAKMMRLSSLERVEAEMTSTSSKITNYDRQQGPFKLLTPLSPEQSGHKQNQFNSKEDYSNSDANNKGNSSPFLSPDSIRGKIAKLMSFGKRSNNESETFEGPSHAVGISKKCESLEGNNKGGYRFGPVGESSP